MRRSRFLIGASLAVALTAALAGGAAAVGGKPYATTLSGSEEVLGGDPDGTGFASITVNPGLGVVCYHLTVQNIDAASLAHIHVGDAGVAGPIVVHFVAPTNGTSSGCADDVSRELAMALILNPSHYYVNVHNPAFPAGAVRGQLGD